MVDNLDVDELAAALYHGIGLVVRRLKQLHAPEELSWPQRAALARLDRGGPSSGATLARAERVSSQAMGVTLAALEARGLVHQQPDRQGGKQEVLSLTPAGLDLLRYDRAARAGHLTKVLAAKLNVTELRTLSRAVSVIEWLGIEL